MTDCLHGLKLQVSASSNSHFSFKLMVFRLLTILKMQHGVGSFNFKACIMHLSFASQAPGYLDTNGDRSQTHSLEADKILPQCLPTSRRASSTLSHWQSPGSHTTGEPQQGPSPNSQPKWSPSCSQLAGTSPCTYPPTITTSAPLLPPPLPCLGRVGEGDTCFRRMGIYLSTRPFFTRNP